MVHIHPPRQDPALELQHLHPLAHDEVVVRVHRPVGLVLDEFPERLQCGARFVLRGGRRGRCGGAGGGGHAADAGGNVGGWWAHGKRRCVGGGRAGVAAAVGVHWSRSRGSVPEVRGVETDVGNIHAVMVAAGVEARWWRELMRAVSRGRRVGRFVRGARQGHSLSPGQLRWSQGRESWRFLSGHRRAGPGA